MKGYKRLTERKNGEAMPLKRPKSNFVATFEEEQRQIDKEILDRLCELEDLIEKNTLLVMLKGRGNGKFLESIKLLEELAELQEYRQKIEQGRLVELPCKVGDIVYSIAPKCKWLGKCTEFDQHCCSRRACDAFITEEKFTLYLFNRIGEDVFLTKEEAEAKRAELRGGK